MRNSKKRVHFHENYDRPETPPLSPRKFGLTVGGILAAWACHPLLKHEPIILWALAAGLSLAVLGAIAPGVLRPLSRAWLGLGLLMGRVMNPVVLGIIYFGVLTPTGWLMRLFGKDVMQLRRDAAASSYWIARTPPGPAPQTLTRQF